MFSKSVKSAVREAQQGFCASPNCTNHIQDIHHKLSDTKQNRKSFPLFTNSFFNAVGLCRDCHTNCNYMFRVGHLYAICAEEALSKMTEVCSTCNDYLDGGA